MTVTAQFSSLIVSSSAKFTDTSTATKAITSWLWDFGDGHTSTLQNPVHQYASGNWTVTLTATDADGPVVATNDIFVPGQSEGEDHPTVSFTYVVANDGTTVQFTDTSVASRDPLGNWLWDFGDGASSTQQNPSHVYASQGNYIVTLACQDYSGASDANQAVQVAPSTVANFTHIGTGQLVQFTDASTTPGVITAWAWDFGDGSTSTDRNPIHLYANSVGGTSPLVTLTITVGGSTTMISIAVPVVAQGSSHPTVNFTSTGPALTVQFTDTSAASRAPLSGWLWDFGDGSSSTLQNPTHTYATAGTYEVTLAVQDYFGPAWLTQDVGVTNGSAPANPIANFSVTVTNLLAQFTDTSTDANGAIAARLWNFGDGQTSTATNPQHIYNAAGQYPVTLTITDLGGATNAKTVTITAGQAPDGDSYSIKAFTSYGALASNVADTVATLGELSALSVTYARDRQLFGASSGGSAPSSVDLTVFSAKNADGTQSVVPSDYANLLLQIGGWMYTQGLNGQFTADPAVFLQAITAQFGASISQIQLGVMTSQSGLWWPDSLTFYFASASAISPGNTAKTRVRLWFADKSFQNQYDEYHIEFVPPIDVLDDFFKSADVIQTEVAAVTLPQTMAKVATVANHTPYTTLNTNIYNWIDPLDKTFFIPTNWTYVIWGAAGNNIDAIKAALQDYILDNSTHSRDEWAEIFPDIFQATEFILTPLWTQYAIPNKTLDPGMYQPTVNVQQGLLFAKETASGVGYTDEHVTNVLNVVPVAWKAMTMLAVGGPQNQGGIDQFATRWPDYIDVPTSSNDFDRMQQNTQAFVRQLFAMLKVAETMTENSDIDPQFTRLHRTNAAGDTILYLAASFNSVQYLIVAKSWMVAKYGATTNTVGSLAIGYDGTFNNGAYLLLNQSDHMSLQFTAVNAQPPLTYEVVDSTISSPSIDASTGLFQGNFPAEGDYSLTLNLIDAVAKGVTQTFAFRFQHPQTGQPPQQ